MCGKRWVGLTLAAATVVAVSGCHTAFGPEPLDRDWRVYEGVRVSFFVRPGSFAEQNVARLSEVLEDQFTSTVATLRLAYAGHLHAYAYNSGAEAHFTSDAAGRAYPETESFRFVAVPPMGDNLFQLMSHEANHVVVIDGLGRAGTYFMTEGLASALLSETFHRSGRHFLFPWTRSHRAQLPRMSTLIDDGGWGRTAQDTAYKSSASFLAWLIDTYGSDRLRQIYPLNSDQMLDRIASIYGRPLDALEAEWLRFVDTWPG